VEQRVGIAKMKWPGSGFDGLLPYCLIHSAMVRPVF
jgi:hypothetical protein